jgi:hypothetical protein
MKCQNAEESAPAAFAHFNPSAKQGSDEKAKAFTPCCRNLRKQADRREGKGAGPEKELEMGRAFCCRNRMKQINRDCYLLLRSFGA